MTRKVKKEPVEETKRQLKIEFKSEAQRELLEIIEKNLITFVSGAAGTGKTFLSVWAAIDHLNRGLVEEIVITRPSVESGHSIGFLPGSAMDKLMPYLLPIFDEFETCMGKQSFKDFRSTGYLSVLPISHIRGKTVKNSFFIVDEASNCSYEEIKLLLTRFGEGSKFVFNGDPTQSDLPKKMQGAFEEISEKLKDEDLIAKFEFKNSDIVRHPIISRILARLE